MKIEQAKTIPISDILDKLNIQPDRQSRNDLYYKSPLRTEKTASFHVDTAKNVWYDHGIGEGGDGVTFVRKWLKLSGVSDTCSDALRWMSNMLGYVPVIAPVQDPDAPKSQPKLTILQKREIIRPELLEYLDSRGLPLSIANEYLVEADVYNREKRKTIFALGFKNDNGGYELRNEFYKASTSPKYITFIRGRIGGQGGGIHIFEGWTDYLSAIIQHENGKRFIDDTIVLNSLSNLKKATPYIKGYCYQTAYTWMDNDEPGRNATASLDAFFQTEENLLHTPMNYIYAPYKDVNAWHMVKLGLTG
ncbi:MAG TPA: CHC2 zinc finger domain-containing protein [Puia sp.]|uniref:CHC2 zinc finger domain-containing protein n=1 Tax=Puia sp. TaxID=2045100 RepID=UPI002D18DC72|nr:CHC2 zinc finger domain-containing protein [Puia sp.]HVU93739.1 CHC2 zinc finger domain-containing protein [Puia sp.]